ncbi:MAG: DUF748 domain-containing protein [Thermoguttaceae bacterium]
MSLATQRSRHVEVRQGEPTVPVPQPRRRRRLLVVGGLILLVLVWMLPGIIARTPLLDSILADATAELNGSLALESVSLGWFSPVVARGVELRDEQDRPVFEATELTGERSLLGILLNRSRLGKFRLTQPKLTVVTRSGGSNLEDVLAYYLTPNDEPTEPVELGLEIAEGSISLTDQETGKTWRIEKVRLLLAVNTAADAEKPLELEVSAEVPDAQQPGRLSIAISSGRASADSLTGEATIDTEAIPLPLLESLVGRFVPRTRLGGRLSSKIHAQWGEKEAAPYLAVQADVTANQFILTTPSLGTDRVQLEQFDLSCRLSKQGNRFEITQSSIHCDLGNLDLAASVDPGDRAEGSSLPAALRQTCELTGRIDLARLAAMLPATLRIREGTQITAGEVQVVLSSKPVTQQLDPQQPPVADAPVESMVWRGRIEANGLRGLHRGRPLSWDRPLLITLDAYDGPEGPIVKELRCDSVFFSLQAAGTLDQLAADATFDLSRLADQAGQFIDFGELRLAGDGWGHFQWKREPTGQFETSVELQVRDLQLALSDRQPWREDKLVLFLSADGRTDFADETHVQQASLEVRLGEEIAKAWLSTPIADLRADSTWPIEVEIKGRLEPWPARLAIWLPDGDSVPGNRDSGNWGPGNWAAGGGYEFNARVKGSTAAIAVEKATLAVRDLDLTSPDRTIKEAYLDLSGSGSWDRAAHRLQIDPISLTGSGLAVQGNNVVLAMPEDGPMEVTGGIGYRMKLGRLTDWFADPEEATPPKISGELTGTAQLRPSAGLVGVQVDATITDFQVVLASGEQFHEPEVRLVAWGDYQPQEQALRLAKLQLSSQMLTADAAGSVQVAKDDGPTNVRFDGTLNYDLQKLTGMLQPYLGSQIRLVGTGNAPFFYHGGLDSADTRAGVDIAWDRADLYGLQIGPGQLKAKLGGGLLETEPMDLAVSNGRLLLTPRLRLTPEPMELTLPPGPLARQVQITPAMCGSLLKYVAPVLADVTAAQGSFSIELDGCRVPLKDPAKAELAGRLTVHSVQIGPGPLVRELAVLLGRESPAVLRRESQVEFRMVEGRVYHRGMELVFPELTIRTYGSVGFDQTLSLMAEMPVPPSLLANRTLDSALRNKIVRVPIGGTLSRPRIDRRELERLSRQFLEDAATNVITDELGRQLNRFFGPP